MNSNKEIGGYIELDTYTGKMLYEDGIKLNCGRNALAYLIRAKGIKKLLFPKYMCNSCDKVINEYGVNVRYYSIGFDFKPVNLDRDEDEWLFLVNFYGQLSDDYIKTHGENVILDNSQAYFNKPISGVDTIYNCRKYFGVPDGAILYTDSLLDEDLPIDESYERMHFLLGRYERSASEFYSEYVDNNMLFQNEPIKKMSKLTENLLHGIDYDFAEKRRTENFRFLNETLNELNELSLTVPAGAFMYPLLVKNGSDIRKELQKKKIYIPTLWPNVIDNYCENEKEHYMAKNILPVPVDQRYMVEDMNYMIGAIKQCLNSGK